MWNVCKNWPGLEAGLIAGVQLLFGRWATLVAETGIHDLCVWKKVCSALILSWRKQAHEFIYWKSYETAKHTQETQNTIFRRTELIFNSFTVVNDRLVVNGKKTAVPRRPCAYKQETCAVFVVNFVVFLNNNCKSFSGHCCSKFGVFGCDVLPTKITKKNLYGIIIKNVRC